MGQSTVAQRRGQDYETEIALQATCGPLRLRGRADGYDPRRRCLEEIKTIRGHPDEIPENRRQLHWAQLQTYGALFCRARDLSEIALALVYFDVASQSEVELRQVFGAEELEEVLAQRCEAFLAWARQEATHRDARDAALKALAFPQETFRAGQRDLAEAVYRTAASGRCLLAQAPTGIGKTIGTLFPLLRAHAGAGHRQGGLSDLQGHRSAHGPGGAERLAFGNRGPGPARADDGAQGRGLRTPGQGLPR